MSIIRNAKTCQGINWGTKTATEMFVICDGLYYFSEFILLQ